jgi:hypothetical protein
MERMNRTLIDEYAAGPKLLENAVQGLTKADLSATPIPGTWSIQQIVVHLVDSDLVASDRMKRVIAEDRPSLIGYDESKFAAALHYDAQPLEDAVELFALNRDFTARILRKLPDSAFGRVGVHNEKGEVTLADLVADYVEHLEHHLSFLKKKRALLGKPL